MAEITYIPKKFRKESLALIAQVREICEDYYRQGYDLTLRQAYYQLVSKDIIPNTDKSYDNLGSLISDARQASVLDWKFITDRTRNLQSWLQFDDPASCIERAARTYNIDLWEGQPYRVECFAPDTPVLTYDGYVPIASIEVGDEVFTHTGRWRKVTSVIKNPYMGEMIRIKASGFPACTVTPGHQFWAKKWDSRKPGYKGKDRVFFPHDWVMSEDLQPRNRLLVPALNPHYRSPMAQNYVLHGGPRSKSVGPVSGDSESFLALLGLYLAEGCIRGDDRTVQWTFSHTERHLAEMLLEWGKCHGINGSINSGKGVWVALLYSKALCDWLKKHCGSGAFHKHLPCWFMYKPIEVQMCLLKYYFIGDGCF